MHWCKTGVAPVQMRFRKVQETLGRPLLPGTKGPFAPSCNHLTPLPGGFVCKSKCGPPRNEWCLQIQVSASGRGERTHHSGLALQTDRLQMESWISDSVIHCRRRKSLHIAKYSWENLFSEMLCVFVAPSLIRTNI